MINSKQRTELTKHLSDLEGFRTFLQSLLDGEPTVEVQSASVQEQYISSETKPTPTPEQISKHEKILDYMNGEPTVEVQPASVEIGNISPETKATSTSQQISAETRFLNYLTDLVKSDTWPAAVMPELLCRQNCEDDKVCRAEAIVAELASLEGLTFLDFGCGEGHCAREALKRGAKKVMAYDLVPQQWPADGVSYSSAWETVQEFGPYDVILLHDVIDHSPERPEEVFRKIKGVRSGNGPVYARFHPWCSRHGTHAYHKVNKAFVHLIFKDEELKELGVEFFATQKFHRPVDLYRKLVVEAGFKIEYQNVLKKPVEEFFMNNDFIKERLQKIFVGKIPTDDLQLEFVDMVLS